MTRDFDPLGRGRFDLLVVGGGIHGLFAALEAARRGLRVALVERDDYGSGLSFNHQRTVHGGLRALQTGNLFKARHQIAERRRWAVMAPAHVRPLPFVLGTYRGTKRSRARLRLGLALYDVVGGARNHDLPASLHLPSSRLLPVDETMARFPSIATSGITGGATWYDYQAIRPDRLNWLVARAAMEAGAVLVNHAEATAGLREHGRVAGARVRDAISGVACEVRSRTTLLAAGAGLPELFERFDIDDTPPRYVAVANILIDRAPLASALAAPGRSGRMLTAVPWGGGTLVGTFQAETAGVPGSPFPLGLEGMLAEANAAFPALAATRGDIRLVHRGWTPADVSRAAVDLLAEPVLVQHALRGVPGLVSLVGVKFTTARSAALAAIDVIAGAGERPTTSEMPDAVRLPGGAAIAPGIEAAAISTGRDAGLTPDVVRHLCEWYGDEALAVIEVARERGLGARLDPPSPVIEAEIAHAVATSHALRLADAVLRRTALGGSRRPSLGALTRAAEVMGHLLGWDDERRTGELAIVEQRFAL